MKVLHLLISVVLIFTALNTYAGHVSFSGEAIALQKSTETKVSTPILRVYNPNSFPINIRVAIFDFTSRTPLSNEAGASLGSIERFEPAPEEVRQTVERIQIPSNSQWSSVDNTRPVPTQFSSEQCTAPGNIPLNIPNSVITCAKLAVNIHWSDDVLLSSSGSINSRTSPKVFVEYQETLFDAASNEISNMITSVTQLN